MFDSMLNNFRSSSSDNDTNSTNIDKNTTRKREVVNEDQDIDFLQTPPNKRAKNRNTGGPASHHFFSTLISSAMNITNKYNQSFLGYVFGKRKKEKPKTIITIDLEDEDRDSNEIKKVNTEQDLIYVGTKSKSVIVEDNQKSRYAEKQTKEEPESSKPSFVSYPVWARKPLHITQIEKGLHCSDIDQSSTPLHVPDNHAKGRIPVFNIPDVPSLPQEEWKHKTYNAKTYEDVKEKRTSFPVYHRAPEAPKPLSNQQKVSLLAENKAFQNNFNVGVQPTAAKLQGKIRVRQTKESIRKPVIVHRHKSTARDVIRLEEKERYKQLLSHFTTAIDKTNELKASNKENSILNTSSQSPLCETKPTVNLRRLQRSLEGSVLSSISSLLPSHPSIYQSTPLSPGSHPTILKVMPSTTKTHCRSDHIEDVPLYSKQESVGILNERFVSPRSSQPVEKDDEILSGTWTKRWRKILSPENLQRERELAKIAREEEKLKLLKTKRREEQQSAIEEVKERIRIEEESEEEEEDEATRLIILTDEMEREVDSALAPGNPGQTLAEGFKISITRGDMATLSNLNWLNDEIINIYFSLITDRSKSQGYPKVHSFNTFFYSKLIKSGYDSLKRWTRRVDIFSMDIIIVPIHLGMHWCLAVIDFRNKTISYYDSLKGSNPQCLDALKRYLSQESMDKKKVPYDTTSWTLSCPKDIPEQLNGCDCGVFACTYAEFITRDAKFTFTQHSMPYFRRRMVYEILKMKLLLYDFGNSIAVKDHAV